MSTKLCIKETETLLQYMKKIVQFKLHKILELTEVGGC